MLETIEPLKKTSVEGPVLPFPLQALERLSWNYFWSWSPDGEAVFRDLDPEIWQECEHNPRQLLKRVSALRCAQMATDPVYLERVQKVEERFVRYMSSPPNLTAKCRN